MTSDHGHEHGDHGDGSPGDAAPPHRLGWPHRLRDVFGPHHHDAADQLDDALLASERGIRALQVSLAVLGTTAVAQAVVVALSGSVALLGDTLHNFADALTAVPLWIAFTIAGRAPNRRYTYGYGRAEDLAGVAILATIFVSALAAGYEAIDRLIHPHAVSHLELVACAALIGFAGNEISARYRIITGRAIGSAALIADGLHARTDGLTSLGVLVGAGGVAIGAPDADAVVGLLITLAILILLKSSARSIYARLMDAVDPALTDRSRTFVESLPGVEGVAQLRIRWIGHRLHAEVDVTVDPGLGFAAAHQLAHEVQHRLLHEIRRLDSAIVHASPGARPGAEDPHALIAHHEDGTPHRH